MNSVKIVHRFHFQTSRSKLTGSCLSSHYGYLLSRSLHQDFNSPRCWEFHEQCHGVPPAMWKFGRCNKRVNPNDLNTFLCKYKQVCTCVHKHWYPIFGLWPNHHESSIAQSPMTSTHSLCGACPPWVLRGHPRSLIQQIAHPAHRKERDENCQLQWHSGLAWLLNNKPCKTTIGIWATRSGQITLIQHMKTNFEYRTFAVAEW